LDLTFRGTQAVPQVIPCFHGFPGEGICPTWFWDNAGFGQNVLTVLHITRDIGVQIGLHSHEKYSEWFIWQYSHSDGGMFNPAGFEPVGNKFQITLPFLFGNIT